VQAGPRRWQIGNRGPVPLPEVPKRRAANVNLAYVLNVIEGPADALAGGVQSCRERRQGRRTNHAAVPFPRHLAIHG